MYLQLKTIVYKTLQENGLQYMANKPHTKTAETIIRLNKSNTKLLQVPFNRKETQEDRGFSFTGIEWWNKLSCYIRDVENLGKF